MSKPPSLSEVTERLESVPVSVAVTAAPGTTAPDGSFTIPRIEPFVCPQAAPPPNSPTNANRYTPNRPVAFIAAPLKKSWRHPHPQAPHFEFFGCSLRKNLTIIR